MNKQIKILLLLSPFFYTCERLEIIRVDAKIEAILPDAAVPGSTITISGNNFTEDVSVFAGNLDVEIISVTSDEIVAIIPLSITTGPTEIIANAKGAPSIFNFEVLPFFIEKTPHPEGVRSGAGFVINNTIYFGLGSISVGYTYNANSDTWTPMNANNSNPIKEDAIGFSANNKGYILGKGSGVNSQLWEFDPVTNNWTQKSNYPNGRLTGPATIVLGTNVYFCTGSNNSGINNQVWRYSTTGDKWTQMNNYGGAKRGDAVGFVVDGTGYVGQGYDANTNSPLNDFYAYNETSDSWVEIAAPLQPSAKLEGGVGFSIGNKGYIGLGRNGTTVPITSFWKYDVTGNSWQQFTSYPGNAVMDVSIFVVGNKAYLMNGSSVNFSESFDEMWEFTPETL